MRGTGVRADSEAGPARLDVLFVAAFDSTNYVYVELIRELTARGHRCTLVVEDETDAINNKMFMNAQVPMVPIDRFATDDVAAFDVAFVGQFVRPRQRRLFAALYEARTFLISFANLLATVTMRIPADLVLTTNTAKFEEFSRAGLDYRMVAVGNPQYDPLVRERDAWRAAHEGRTEKILVVDQGAYPFGVEGKRQLGSTLVALARNNPDKQFFVKPRYLPGEVGEQAHIQADHLFDHLSDAPGNLVLLREACVLEEILLDYDAMITTWSTAHLDAAVLGMPLLLISGLDSVDVFDVRAPRVAATYAHLESTGCVVGWCDLLAGPCPLRPADPRYVDREFYDLSTPCAPRIADIVERVGADLVRDSRRFASTFQLGFSEFMDAWETLPLTPSDTAQARLEHVRFRRVNAAVQDLVFDNRCLGSVLDMTPLAPYFTATLPEGAGPADVDAQVAQVRSLTRSIAATHFAVHSDAVSADKFTQDHYFKFLWETGQRDRLLAYDGPVVVPESLAYYRGLAYLKRGRLIRASRLLVESFDISLRKPVREIKKDKDVTALLAATHRSLLAHAILLFLFAYGKDEALVGLQLGYEPGAAALAYYQARALERLGRTEAASTVVRAFLEEARAAGTGTRSAAAARGGLKGLALRAAVALYSGRLQRLARRLARA